MTRKQRTFVAEYLIDLNATKAAERAGYSKRTANEQGARLLANVSVSAAIAEEQAARFQKLGITADAVLKELAVLGFSNMADYITVGANGDVKVELSKLTREQAAAIASVEVDEDENGVKRTRFRLCDKRAALVDLGKHLKLFTDKVEHAVDPGKQLTELLDALIGAE
jgi:phage terminase small subunit